MSDQVVNHHDPLGREIMTGLYQALDEPKLDAGQAAAVVHRVKELKDRVQVALLELSVPVPVETHVQSTLPPFAPGVPGGDRWDGLGDR